MKSASPIDRGLRLLGAIGFMAVCHPSPAFAWGKEGHEIVALIARSYLTASTRDQVDQLLATDWDNLTAHDMASAAVWADEYREHGHGNTAKWHYIDIELDQPDIEAACFGFPPAADPPYFGAENDCVIDKIEELDRDLADAGALPARRVMDLKYLLHFVGDIHQPLHAADNYDRGGNCTEILVDGERPEKLHSYWDTDVVEALGHNPDEIAAKLRAAITPAEISTWQKGGSRDWAMESFEVAKRVAYPPGALAGCTDSKAPIDLPEGYPIAARTAAAIQLEKAGVRLAWLLNRDLPGR